MTLPSKIKRQLQGVVISNKMKKTVVVRVDRLKKHPKYKKYFSVSKKYKAHDEKEQCQVGDKVIIEECRPISKEKKWRVKRVIEKSDKSKE
jgi:small subunit ribosomal protein S17